MGSLLFYHLSKQSHSDINYILHLSVHQEKKIHCREDKPNLSDLTSSMLSIFPHPP